MEFVFILEFNLNSNFQIYVDLEIFIELILISSLNHRYLSEVSAKFQKN